MARCSCTWDEETCEIQSLCRMHLDILLNAATFDKFIKQHIATLEKKTEAAIRLRWKSELWIYGSVEAIDLIAPAAEAIRGEYPRATEGKSDGTP
jgi:hypothetical protein